MNNFKTDENKIINSFNYHDLIFHSLRIDGDKLTLTIKTSDNKRKTIISLHGVKYLEIAELIPVGIVLSCYSFRLNACPEHLKDELDFANLQQYVDKEDALIFYADGTMGFEIIVAHINGYSESKNI